MSLMLKFSWEMLFFESGDTEVLKLIEISCLQVIKGKLTVRLTKSGCLTCFTHICQLCVPTIVEVSLRKMSFPETSHLWRESVGRVTCPVLGLCYHGDANSCARSLSMSVPRSLMMVISGAAFRLSREQKTAFQRYSVCWLCKSFRLFSWIKKIKNCCEQRWTF